MGAVTSLVVFAIGAILSFATNFHSATWNISTIGVILMIVGVVGLVLSVIAFFYPDGFGMGGVVRRRRTVGRSEAPDPTRRFPATIREEERSGY